MMDKDEIADYLRAHPDFFNGFPELLEQLAGDPDTEGSPFVERQLQVLKDREAQQQQRIELIIDSVRNNQKLEQDMLRFAAALLAHDKDAVDARSAVLALLKQQFNMQATVLILAADAPAHAHYDALQQRVNHASSACDDRVSTTLLQGIFGDQADAIGSCAFIPLLQSEAIVGVVILGAADPARFHPDMGVAFLDNLGLLISSFLSRARPASEGDDG